MKIGDLVTVVGFGIGVIVETDFDEDNEEPLFKVAFFNEFRDDWFYDGYIDSLKVIE